MTEAYKASVPDAIYIEVYLSDVEQLLSDNARLTAALAAKENELRQAVEDLYKACQYSPCNNGVCATKNCTGNKIPCKFEWRGAKKGEG